MATLLYRLGKTAYRRWPLFIAAWLIAMIAVVSVAGAFSKPMSDAFSIPGIPSERAADLQSELFAGAPDAFDQASVKVVVAAPKGELLSDPANKADVDALVADLSALPQMPDGSDQTKPVPANPVDAAADLRTQLTESAKKSGSDLAKADADATAISPLSEDGRVGTITWDFDVETVADVKPSTIESLKDTMAESRDQGLQVEANGSGTTGMPEIGGKSELIGIAVAILVLILTFGSLVAAGSARAHGALRRRPGHHRHHRDDGVHGHRLHHSDAGDDDRSRRRDRLRAVHPRPLSKRARPHRRPRGGHWNRRWHGRVCRGLRRTDGPDRPLGTRGGKDPVPHHDGYRCRRHRPHRRARGADTAPAVLGLVKSKAFGGRVRRTQPKRDARESC